jgi:hypothetical protein
MPWRFHHEHSEVKPRVNSLLCVCCFPKLLDDLYMNETKHGQTTDKRQRGDGLGDESGRQVGAILAARDIGHEQKDGTEPLVSLTSRQLAEQRRQ